jgi:hypothetical protein
MEPERNLGGSQLEPEVEEVIRVIKLENAALGKAQLVMI